jgi:prophage DNA circulation protein
MVQPLQIAPLTITVISTGAQLIFTSFEVPERIPFGGRQTLAVQKLIGGKRTVDAMGKDDKPLAWSGRFLGQNALARARFLDYLRTSGELVHLNWSEMSYMVVVEDFAPDFEREYNIPYSISCMVVENNAQPISTVAAASLDDAMRGDMTTANTLGSGIGDGPLSATLATLDTAIKAVSNFAAASQSVISSVITPLAAVQSRVNMLISTVGSTANNVSSFGGLLPNTSVARQASQFSSQAVAATQLPQLYNLQAVAGRMGLNLGQGK